MSPDWLNTSGSIQRSGVRRIVSGLYLNLIAGLILISILAISIQAMWTDRQSAWQEAEQSSRNILTGLTRDIGNNLALLDLALKGVIEGLRYQKFKELPPEVQHRMLFDRAVSATFPATILLLDEAGDLIADGGSVVAPRPMNFSHRDFFTTHKEHSFIGLYMSRPYRSRLGNLGMSITISRRLSHPDGKFIGVVAAVVSLSEIGDMFQSLHLGRGGSISFLRDDGIMLMRQPYDEGNIGRDLSKTPNVQRFIKEGSGTFEGSAAIDGVRRLFTFGRVDNFPLILTVARSVDDILSAWNRKAIVLALVTGALCAAVLGLTTLFQRELRRRTKAEAELARLARTDALTGLPNRRAFDEVFHREWKQAIRSGSSISLLFVDADFFKNYNDQYGHAKGDDLLCAIAITIDAIIRRPRDFAARYGGEEFTVLLPETDHAGAHMIAENIRRAIMKMGVEHERSHYGVATVSIGVASAQPSLGSLESTLIKVADAGLYNAKASGRNCVRGIGADGARALKAVV